MRRPGGPRRPRNLQPTPRLKKSPARSVASNRATTWRSTVREWFLRARKNAALSSADCGVVFRFVYGKNAKATGLELDSARLSLASEYADRLTIGGDLDAAGVSQSDTNFPGAFDSFRFGRLHDFREGQLIVHVDADPGRLSGFEIDFRRGAGRRLDCGSRGRSFVNDRRSFLRSRIGGLHVAVRGSGLHRAAE